MIVFRRPIKFEEVDAANIVFFARFATYAHEAMEDFFSPVEGGYAGLIVKRRVGLPAVHLETEFLAPLQYGDALRIETTVARLGKRSAVLHYRMFRESDGALACDVKHTVVTTDLVALKSIDMPADVRACFEAHCEPGARGS